MGRSVRPSPDASRKQGPHPDPGRHAFRPPWYFSSQLSKTSVACAGTAEKGRAAAPNIHSSASANPGLIGGSTVWPARAITSAGNVPQRNVFKALPNGRHPAHQPNPTNEGRTRTPWKGSRNGEGRGTTLGSIRRNGCDCTRNRTNHEGHLDERIYGTFKLLTQNSMECGAAGDDGCGWPQPEAPGRGFRPRLRASVAPRLAEAPRFADATAVNLDSLRSAAPPRPPLACPAPGGPPRSVVSAPSMTGDSRARTEPGLHEGRNATSKVCPGPRH